MRNPLHIKVPRTVRKGDIVRLMTKLNHPMEPGWRSTPDGAKAPKKLMGSFICLLDGTEVFRAALDSGTASDPFLSFYVRVSESGIFRFVWTGDGREHYEAEASVTAE